jgi:hypothetical protein
MKLDIPIVDVNFHAKTRAPSEVCPVSSVVITIVIFIRQCLGDPGFPHSCHKSLDFVGAHGNSLYGAHR